MKRRTRKAFTVVELLVVVAIIAMLVGLLIPAVNRARATARQTQCINNQKQLNTAVQTYFTSKGRLPDYVKTARRDAGGKPVDAYGWIHPLLPNIGQANLNDKILDAVLAPTPTPINAPTMGLHIGLLVCPSDPPVNLELAPLSYAPNAGRAPDERLQNAQPNLPVDWPENGAFSRDLPSDPNNVPLQQPTVNTIDMISRGDGAQTTILLSENVRLTTWNETSSPIHQAMWWRADPLGNGEEPNRPFARIMPPLVQPVAHGEDALLTSPSSRHDGGFIVAFCDNHVQFVNDQISYAVFARLMSSNGAMARQPGQTISVPPIPSPHWQNVSVSDSDLQ